MLWYSLEVPHLGASIEYPQLMFSSRDNKDISIFWMKKARYLLLCMNNHQWLELLMSQINFHGSKVVQAIEVLLYIVCLRKKGSKFICGKYCPDVQYCLYFPGNM